MSKRAHNSDESTRTNKKPKNSADFDEEENDDIIERPPLPDLSHLSDTMKLSIIVDKYTVPALKLPKIEHLFSRDGLALSLCDGCIIKNKKGGVLLDGKECVFNIRLCAVCSSTNTKRGYAKFYGVTLHNVVNEAIDKERKKAKEASTSSSTA